LGRYHFSGDRGKLAELAACFTGDGVLVSAAFRAEGREAIAKHLLALMDTSHPSLKTVQHHLTTTLIEPEGEAIARCRSYFMVLTDIGLDHAGSYHDRLVLRDQQWLIAERSVRLNWISAETLFAIG
jgi:hypothetical protein